MSVRGDDDTIASALPAVQSATISETALVGGRYKIVRWLGGGGMGRVYEALDTELGERVALKMLRSGLTDDAIARFRREVRLTRRIQHKNVARMFDIGEHAPDAGLAEAAKFLTMELVDGEPLTKHLGEPMPWHRLRDVATQICAGLAAAHAAGVVHRDLKPDNVLLEGATGRVVITDFGIARGGSEDASVTQIGAVVGTPRYMAPEQLAGRDVDPRADLFSLGVMLFELATGTRPWSGDNAIAIAVAQATQPPRPLTAPHVPPTFAALVGQCLQLSPEQRPASAAAIANALASGVGIAPPRDEVETVDLGPRATAPPLTPVPAAPTHVSTHDTAIAVLPVTCAPGDEYLADGVLDDLIDTLSSTGTLRVRPAGLVRTRTDIDPRSVGRELAVDHVVVASLRRTPAGLRISARLISVADGFQIWAHRLDTTEAEILAAADQLGNGIANALSTRAAAGTRPTDPRAVDLYLRARAELRHYWGDHARKAAELLDQAVGFAPTSPPILAAQAWASTQAWVMSQDPLLAPRARHAIDRALPTGHGEAFLASAQWRINTGDLEGGAGDLGTALVRAPMSAQAHENAGKILVEIDAGVEGRYHLETALGLDPGRAKLISADIARLDALEGNWAAADARIDALLADEDLSVAQLGAVFKARLAGWRRDRPGMIEPADRFASRLGGQAMRILMFVRMCASADQLDERVWHQIGDAFMGADRPKRLQVLGLQIMAELAVVLGRHDLATERVRFAAAFGLIDVTWLDRCPLFEEIRQEDPWRAVRDEVAARAGRVHAAFRATAG